MGSRKTAKNADVLYGVPGCYVIEHPSTGCFYVGSTKSLSHRQNTHRCALKKNSHTCAKLQELFNSDPDWTFKPIPTETRDEAFDIEQKLIDENKGNPLMLNIADNARFSTLGTTMSEDTKSHLSKMFTGKRHTDEAKQKISEGLTGKCSEAKLEHLRRLAESNRKHT
jgi:group I intron endonuclease